MEADSNERSLTPLRGGRAQCKPHLRWITLILAIATVAFHAKVLFLPGWTFPWDFRGHHLPLATAYADAIHEGTLPFWDPYTYCGRPLLANPQVATFYPGMFLAVVPGRSMLIERLEWLAAFHVFLAGLLAFLLGRRMGLEVPASLLTALSFSLGGGFVSQMEHLSSVCAAPWLVLSWLACFARPSWRMLGFSLAWAMSFFVGFPAFTLMTVASTVLFGAFQCDRRRLVRDVVAASVLSAGMVCAQLGPSLELVAQSVGKYRTDWLAGGGGIPLAALLSLVVPNFHHVFDLEHFQASSDPTQMYLYVGLCPLILALISGRRPDWRLWGCCGMFLILMLGEHTPLGLALFRILPGGVKQTIYWYLFMAPFLLSVTLLAGRGTPRRSGLAWIFCAVTLVDLLYAGANRPLNSASIQQNPEASAESVDGSTQFAQTLRTLAGDLRIDTADDGLYLMSGAPILRWRAANGYDPLALERLIQLRLAAAEGHRWGAYYQIEKPDSAALDVMSVRVLTSRRRLVTSRLTEYGQQHGRWLYLNPTALPRYRADHCTLARVAEARNRVEIVADCESPGRIQTSEIYYTAWRAEIDGQPIPVSIVNTAFRGVNVPKGRHKIVMAYSTDLVFGCTLASCAAWAIWLILLRQAKKKDGPWSSWSSRGCAE